MKKKFILIIAIIFLLIIAGSIAYFFSKIKADTITYNRSGSHPLPYIVHWSGKQADEMLGLVKRGHAVIPTFPSEGMPDDYTYQVKTLLETKKYGLPIDMTATQWEDVLRQNDYLNIDRNPATDAFTGTRAMDSTSPNNIFLDNTFKTYRILDKYYAGRLDPLGPEEQIGHWGEVGRLYANKPEYKFYEEAYPDPPGVFIVGNNESKRIYGGEIEKYSKRFNELYPNALTDFKDFFSLLNFANRVVGDGWIKRYNTMFQAWRDSTENPKWSNVKFAGYNGFGDIRFRLYSSANWASGLGTATTYEGDLLPDANNSVPRIDFHPYAWDGASPQIYLHTDYTDIKHLVGPQLGSMNWVFMIEEAKKIKPDFHFELCVTNGSSSNISPDHYGGVIQYSAWVTRPETIRDFRDDHIAWETKLPEFIALTKVANRVHRQPVLADFWQNGELVENPVGHHPWQATQMTTGYTDEEIKAKYGVGRWYYLYSNLDAPYRVVQEDGSLGGFPDMPANQVNPEMAAYSMAMVKGEAPNREWLVYTYSPTVDKTGITVTVPDFGDIGVDPKVIGSFYHLKESDRSITEIKDSAPTLTHILVNHPDPIVAPGAQLQFSVTGGKDQYDADAAVSAVTWSATGGTIDQNGLFTAGQTLGNYQIVVSSGGITETIPLKIDTLIGYWKLDEGNGKYAADSTGRNNGCYNVGGSWDNNGKFGSSGLFTGAGRGIECSADEFIVRPEEFSISFWIKATERTQGYPVEIRNGGWEVRFDYDDVAKKAQVIFSPINRWFYIPFVAGQWHQVTGVFKGGQYVRIYADGQLITESTTDVAPSINLGDNNILFGDLLKASVDQVRLYNIALSGEEILDLYNENPSSNPNITLTKSVSKTDAQPGELVDYTITYQNNGAQDATNVVITDILPANLTLVSAPGAQVSGQTLIWNIPSVPTNEPPRSVEVQCRVN